MNNLMLVNLTIRKKCINCSKTTNYENSTNIKKIILNRLITIKEFEFVIQKLLNKKSPGLEGFTSELYQIFKKELTPNLALLTFYTWSFFAVGGWLVHGRILRSIPGFYQIPVSSFSNCGNQKCLQTCPIPHWKQNMCWLRILALWGYSVGI